ncbi:MAG: helix-turn-helix transcriptional regulator [Bacteroidales bacterium]|nr:helix-turn-helix transcriptional regulator [Bacteroidales bacterium]
MTAKQEKILKSALELFAKEGYKATSTSKVAKHAGVSEGLIFRHFTNKEGLLDAILKEGEEQAKLLFSDIVFETEPKEVLRKAFAMLENLQANKAALEFWKLQYKIKWETEKYGEHKTEPLELALASAFKKLGFANPEQEALFMLIIVDGIAMHYFLKQTFDLDAMIALLKAKYEV